MLPNHLSCSGWIRSGAIAAVLLLAVPLAQAADNDAKPKSAEQLEQLVAPIALYPDSLLSQVLMASTYPLEVVEAARWIKTQPTLEKQALEDALQSQSWDPSVKSLTAFPQTLALLSDKLQWTTDLGDAFLAQQKNVMNAVQALRQKAKAADNLKSNEQQTVTVEDKPTGTQTQTILIEPANPQVVYVPTYNPMVVYGPWAYPAYRPFYWYPVGYVATGSAISFGVGFAVGSAMWGGCNWGHSTVDINVNRYNSFNRTNIHNTTWNHNSAHRRGVSYANSDLQNRYGGHQTRNQQARDGFRGRAEQGRQGLAKGDADRFKGSDKGSFDAAGNRSGGEHRSEASRSQARSRGSDRWSNRGDSAFKGMGNGRETRRQSNRGSASRGGRSGRGGGGRGGGGMRRGGGGRGRR
jgi:hypothetical protein